MSDASNKLITINISKPQDYHTQHNNIIRPGITCNDTAMVMGLIYSGYGPLPEDGVYQQEEDRLTNFMLTDPRVDDEYKKLFPDEHAKYIKYNKDPKKSYPPNELHPVLSYGTNLWMGKNPGEVTRFRWDLSLSEIAFELLNNRAVVQSGVWAKLNHITCMVGFTTLQPNIREAKTFSDIDTNQILDFIMDDSYGDYHSGYSIQAGNDIHVSKEDYLKYVKPVGEARKWGHIFMKRN